MNVQQLLSLIIVSLFMCVDAHGAYTHDTLEESVRASPRLKLSRAPMGKPPPDPMRYVDALPSWVIPSVATYVYRDTSPVAAREYIPPAPRARRMLRGSASIGLQKNIAQDAPRENAPGTKRKLDAFDLIGALPGPMSFVSNGISGVAGATVVGGIGSSAWNMILTAASVSYRENRELSNEEACEAFFGGLPYVGMLPIWSPACKNPDTCYHPELVSYGGLRDDDPEGRYVKWVRWMEKYCKDVDWRPLAPRAQAYIARSAHY